jgi:hypothetical protein
MVMAKQDTTLDLDLPWAEYVSTRLQATGRVEDYLLAQVRSI